MLNIKELYNQTRIARSSLKDLDLSNLDADILEFGSPKQIVWHLMTGVNSIPLCENPTCNNKTQWDNVDNRIEYQTRGRYRSYCSSKCSNNSDKVKIKKEKTSVSNFGTKYHNQSNIGKNSRKNTNLNRYGVINPSLNDDVKKKKILTTMANYGVINPSQSEIIQKKKIETNIKLYGNTHYNNRHITALHQEILSNKNLLEFELQSKSIKELALEMNVNKSTIIRKIHHLGLSEFINASYLEQEMRLFLDLHNINYIQNTRLVIPPKELDFYLPEYNLAIEMNGDYWHSDIITIDKKYHYNKWMECDSKNIRLIQIWESDWCNNRDKFQRMILSALGLKLSGPPGRKCNIMPVTAKLAKPFVNAHHLQGFVHGHHWGAFDNTNQLVGIMTFGMSRNQHFELKRWVTDDRTHPGLFSKTFQHAQRHMGFVRVVSFSMNDWFTGQMYQRSGFENNGIIPPSYRYLYEGSWRHCSYFTRTGIKRKLPDYYYNDLTEFQMMDQAGVLRGWDSGKIRWIWNK